MNKIICQECGKTLNPKRIIWLELDSSTGRYHFDEVTPESNSQGSFPFGKDCAIKVGRIYHDGRKFVKAYQPNMGGKQ